MAEGLHITVEKDPGREDVAAVQRLLRDYNESWVETGYLPLLVVARDEERKVQAGLWGATYWSWLYVDALAVAEEWRGRGVGSELLRAAEREGSRRGCRNAFLDTTTFQARPFYEKQGYRIFGQLQDFPPGHTRYFLTKSLAPEADGIDAVGSGAAPAATRTPPTCRVVRPDDGYAGKQGLVYGGAVSAQSVGSQGLCMHLVEIPPGARARPHLHQGHETSLYVLSGTGAMWYGDDLSEHLTVHVGEFLYIPAGVPHMPYNPSATETTVAVLARTDPNEQESVVLREDLWPPADASSGAP